ncbi:MAG: hypothetical protein ACOC4S_00500 [Balneolaceae bacterium]
MRKSLTSKKIWQWPVVISIVSTVGLAASLFGDGIFDALSWIALAIPVITCLWFIIPHGIQLFD